ncbi:amidase [Parvularcula bermudensis HTCC2503]|uniref:Amidase n=1 Tax=Parvularcula bermudensis (strain ATCC BAA-594 / HTCC2503 / KCTC 12087) TaxID=314260 RepID=E0TCW3_PARBH|nr:AtzE family amidohydrolase [Parvularcula bermudensis]ADM10346.1 amidase [Parvularcula bermudensis HTCC2503]
MDNAPTQGDRANLSARPAGSLADRAQRLGLDLSPEALSGIATVEAGLADHMERLNAEVAHIPPLAQHGPAIGAIVDAVKGRQQTPRDIALSALAVAREANRDLSCFTRFFEARALADAARVEARLARGEDPGPLAGVPYAVKDLFGVAGEPTTAGAQSRETAPPEADDCEAIRRLGDAGAILIGSTMMDEYAYGFVTVNSHYGTTKNPHALDRLAGGSSGGSAAAVAAGLVPFALGSDTNGSVRVPASLCGVFGLRPSHGDIPTEGVFPFVPSLDTVGAFARSAADLALVHAVLRDRAFVGSERALRIGWLDGYFTAPLDPSLRARLDTAITSIGESPPITLPEAGRARSAAFLLTAADGGRGHLGRLRQHRDQYDPSTRDRLLAGALLPDDRRADARRAARAFAVALDEAFDKVDLLVTLTTPSEAPAISDPRFSLGGEWVDARRELGLFTQPFGLSGVPAMSLPLPSPPGTLPIGLQLIGPRGRDDLVIEAALRLAQAGTVAPSTPPYYRTSLPC